MISASYRDILRIVIPMVLSNMAFTVMQFTDRVLLARYSSEAIQAALPAGILGFTLLTFFTSIASYSGTFVAQYYGAGNPTACRRACAAGLHLSAAIVPICILLIPLCYWLLSVSGHPPSLQVLERPYAFWTLVGGPFVAMQWTLGGYLSGTGRVNLCSFLSVLGCAANIFLDILFIFGPAGCPSLGIPGSWAAFFHVPEMGIEGAAIATTLSCVLSCILMLIVTLRMPENRGAPVRDWVKPDVPLLRRVLRFGTPAGIQSFFDLGAFAVFVVLTGRLDALSLAASNIVLSINNLAFSPLIGFSTAASIIVGQLQGAQQSDLAKKAGFRCLHLGWIYMAFIATVFICFTHPLLEIFRSPDAPYTVEELYNLGRALLICIIVWGFFDTMNVTFIGALKGAGDTKMVMLILTIGGWLVWVPAEVLCLLVLGGTIVDAWILQCVYIILLSLIFLGRWYRGRWQKIRLIT